MKRDQWQSRIRVAAMAFSLLFSAGIIFCSTAQAQYPNYRDDQGRERNWDQYGNYGGSTELRQTALNAGYNYGVREGSNDRQNNRNNNYQLSSTYRKATDGYNSRLGDRELYRRYFREGFGSGYNNNGQSTLNRDDRDQNRDVNNNGTRTRHGRNWDGYGNYGGSADLRQTALNAGYNEGIKQGRKDRNRRNRSDYRNQGNYRNATHDYSSRLGDRDVYQRYYREAYETGYDDGINGN